MEFLVSILGAIMLAELYVWLPRLCDILLERAVRSLPEEERARWREEWRADQAAMPNSIWRFFNAVGYNWAAFKIVGSELSDDNQRISSHHTLQGGTKQAIYVISAEKGEFTVVYDRTPFRIVYDKVPRRIATVDDPDTHRQPAKEKED